MVNECKPVFKAEPRFPKESQGKEYFCKGDTYTELEPVSMTRVYREGSLGLDL